MSSNLDDVSTIPDDPRYDDGMPETEWLSEREARAWRGLQVMQLRLNGALARQLAAESQLSYQDYLVLVALTENDEGRLRLFELGRVLGWEKSRLSHHVSRMEQRGLVSKEACDADRRGFHVVVTAAGRRAIKAAAPGHVEAVRRLFIEPLTPRQLDAIAAAAELVLAAIEAAEVGCDELELQDEGRR